MPDDDKPASWTPRQWGEFAVIVLTALVTLVMQFVNHGKVDAIQGTQTQQVQKQEEDKDTLAQQTAKTDAKLATIEKTATKIETTAMKTAATVEDSAGIQLYNAWKNLEWLAYESGKPEDVKKAAEAKQVFDTFRAIQGKK